MTKIPRRTPESRLPKMEHEVPMPKVVPPKRTGGVLSKLLEDLPDDFKRRVQSAWVSSDGNISIDFVPDGGDTSEEAEG